MKRPRNCSSLWKGHSFALWAPRQALSGRKDICRSRLGGHNRRHPNTSLRITSVLSNADGTASTYPPCVPLYPRRFYIGYHQTSMQGDRKEGCGHSSKIGGLAAPLGILKCLVIELRNLCPCVLPGFAILLLGRWCWWMYASHMRYATDDEGACRILT